MNWINWFELLEFGVAIIGLSDLVSHSDWRSIYLVGAGLIVGNASELFVVGTSHLYHYNEGFVLAIGKRPYHFPLFGGFAWGLSAAYALKIARKFQFNRIITALLSGWVIVTTDLICDVIAIRLDGGFWTWANVPVTLAISKEAFMGVPWGNFLGYLVMIPTVVWLFLWSQQRTNEDDHGRQVVYMVAIAVVGGVIAMAGNFAAYKVNLEMNSCFTVAAFVILWSTLAIMMVSKAVKEKARLSDFRQWNMPMLIFWAAQYIFNLTAVIHLGIHVECMWYLILGILLLAATVFACLMEPLRGPVADIS